MLEFTVIFIKRVEEKETATLSSCHLDASDKLTISMLKKYYAVKFCNKEYRISSAQFIKIHAHIPALIIELRTHLSCKMCKTCMDNTKFICLLGRCLFILTACPKNLKFFCRRLATNKPGKVSLVHCEICYSCALCNPRIIVPALVAVPAFALVTYCCRAILVTVAVEVLVDANLTYISLLFSLLFSLLLSLFLSQLFSLTL